jgi:hypothetical protein
VPTPRARGAPSARDAPVRRRVRGVPRQDAAFRAEGGAGPASGTYVLSSSLLRVPRRRVWTITGHRHGSEGKSSVLTWSAALITRQPGRVTRQRRECGDVSAALREDGPESLLLRAVSSARIPEGRTGNGRTSGIRLRAPTSHFAPSWRMTRGPTASRPENIRTPRPAASLPHQPRPRARLTRNQRTVDTPAPSSRAGVPRPYIIGAPSTGCVSSGRPACTPGGRRCRNVGTPQRKRRQPPRYPLGARLQDVSRTGGTPGDSRSEDGDALPAGFTESLAPSTFLVSAGTGSTPAASTGQEPDSLDYPPMK